MPSTSGSALSALSTASTSAWVDVAGRRLVMERMPAASVFSPLDFT
jgi:hypothetical protein